MTKVLWDLNADRVLQQIKAGKRIDGRGLDEYRDIKIETEISKNADGSARVWIGESDVIAGVKIVPGEPYPDSPDKGSIGVGVELLALASPEFEPGPPREDAIEIARVVDRGIRESKTLDFRSLCITEGELVLIAFIDMYVINNAGNLFDAGGIAAMKALLETRVPKLEDGKIVKGEYSGKLKLSSKPLLSTFAKIGNKIVLDPSNSEEHAMTSRFSVATMEKGTVSAFQKGGSGSFSGSEIDYCIDLAFDKAKAVRKML